jgi:type II secretory pathway pseudopilin PulG
MIKNQKGSVTILALIVMVIMFIMLALAIDVTNQYATKIKAQHSLNLALRAASSQISIEALTDAYNPRVEILPDDAWSAFNLTLRQNLSLDSNNQPYLNSPLDGPVSICYFKVINSSDIPYTYNYSDYSETIDKVSVTGIISFPVKMSAFAQFISGVPEYQTMYVHSTVGPEMTPKP